MSEYGVVADDLTGANATGVLLTERGLPAATLFAGGAAAPGIAALLWSTASRALPAEEAYRRVVAAARELKGVGVRNWAKRIDSTVRGNLGPEIDALLDLLGPDTVAVVTPAFPASARVVAGGYLLVHGVPVSETAAARDVATPVREAHVPTLLAAQTRHRVAHLPLATVLRGAAAIAAQAQQLVADGARVLVADATTDAHLELLAAGLEASGITYFPADPGPLTAAVFARRAGLTARTTAAGAPSAASASPAEPGARRPGTSAAAGAEPRQHRPLLLVSGSVTPLTFAQLAFVRAELRTAELSVPAVGPDDLAGVARAFASSIPGDTDVVLVTTANSAADVLSDLDAASLRAVAQRLGALARELLSSRGFRGIVTTGGDVTLAVCAALGAHGIALEREVLPLAARGSLLGGRWEGLPIVTKGGLVGDNSALYLCCRSILEGDLA